jgi:hypothetical protein
VRTTTLLLRRPLFHQFSDQAGQLTVGIAGLAEYLLYRTIENTPIFVSEILGGQHNDWNFAPSIIFAHLTQELESIHDGHH